MTPEEIIAVCGILIKKDEDGSDKILMTYRNFPPKVWSVPGGRVEYNGNGEAIESLEEALAREIREETKLEINTNYRIIGESQYQVDTVCQYPEEYVGKPMKIKFFICEYLNGNVILDEEHSQFKWMSEHDLFEVPRDKLDHHYTTYHEALKHYDHVMQAREAKIQQID